MSHEETDKWVAQFQPNCLPGYNHGTPAGRIRLGELGSPSAWTIFPGQVTIRMPPTIKAILLLNSPTLFSRPMREVQCGSTHFRYMIRLCLPAEKIYEDYLGAVKFGNIFSLNVGPDYAGRIREIDVTTLKQVGKYIKGKIKG